jgi:DNA (cytosine-5)-methyltransferase 1
MNTNFDNVGTDIDSPAPTITANRKWHYLMNPQYFNAGGSVDNPCFTLIARMDKMPPYLVVTEAGELAIEVYDTDDAQTRKIKEFMALYGITDIKMRMLKITELKRIMGFPANYTLIGTHADQKKFIGNAVEVNMARVLCEALVQQLNAAA